MSAAVCRELANFHRAAARPSPLIASWDYEQELTRSSLETLAIATTARDAGGYRYWTRVGDLNRVVSALPRLRADLMAGGVTFIHGDVHPGNVIVTRRGRARRVVLIDWARARLRARLRSARAAGR